VLRAKRGKPKKDRRQSNRVDHQVLVYVAEREHYYVTRNLSEKGCQVAMQDPPPVGTQLSLLVHLPGHKVFQTRGVVRHSDRQGNAVGIEFVELGLLEKVYLSFLRGVRLLKESKEFYEAVKEAQAPQRRIRIREAARKTASALRIINTILIVFFLSSVIYGVAKHNLLERHRRSVARELAKMRDSTVITMVHRQETVGLLGIPVKQYIKVEDAESVLRAIRSVPDDKPIDFIVHTPGGILFSAYQIARALKEHKGNVTVFVPHYAMSGGTLIALAADQIVMDKDAILGPVDPQLIEGNKDFPAVSLVNIPRLKPWKEIDDSTVIMIDQARKSLKQIRQMVKTLLDGRMPQDRIDAIVTRLTSGQITHDYPIFPDEAEKLGLPVSTNMPEQVYKLMALYPQPGGKSTSRAG